MTQFKSLAIVLVLGLIISWGVSLLTASGFGFEYLHSWFLVFLVMLASSIIVANNKGSLDKPLATATAFLGASILIAVIISSKMVRSEDYVSSVEVQEANITALETSPDHVRKVTLDMAYASVTSLIGQKVDGVQLSSQYQVNLDAASVQEVNNELVWVLPLDYSGFSKWVKQDSIPGYLVVSATDPLQKPKLVLGKKIKISQNGFFGDGVSRVAWFRSGFKSTEEHFEIDDKGNGYWISPVIKPSIGFSLDTVNSVLVINAETKESTQMSIKDTMKKYPWIDRIWTEAIIQERLEAYGSLKDGWLNTVFGETNVNKPTSYEDQELWMIKAGGKLQWFSGMTSVNSDKSLVSAIMVEANGGTTKPILREVPLTDISDENGAIEAINSGLGADGNRWHAVLPQPVFYKGDFFWNASVVSDSNLFQKTGLIKAGSRQKAYYGTNIEEALQKTQVKEVTSTKDAIIAEIITKIDELNVLKAQLEAAK